VYSYERRRKKRRELGLLLLGFLLVAISAYFLVPSVNDQWQERGGEQPELAPYQVTLGKIGKTWIIFDGNLYTPDGRQSLLAVIDAFRSGAYRHLQDLGGFLEGQYANQGDAMPYSVSKVQRILHNQGMTDIHVGDGAILDSQATKLLVWLDH